MKRSFNCSESLTHFLSQPLDEEDSIYNREFQSMGDDGGGGGEDYGGEEPMQTGEKKRRLSNHQVKSLEKIFEVDNKLDPDQKVKVAQELGLQPRQVAIWFQNRRARWKTKQLERDYNVLKSNYEALKHSYHKLEQEKETIIQELIELKTKFQEETIEFGNKEKSSFTEPDPTNMNHDVYSTLNHDETRKQTDLKDGFSDSDSSGVLNDENINLNISQLLNMSGFGLCSSSTTPSNRTQFLNSKTYQQQGSMTMDDDPFSVNNSEDESCNIFLVDQAPNLCWYFHDQRN